MWGFRAFRPAMLVAACCLGFSAWAATPGSATYTYDGLGRIIAVVYEDGTGQFYTYDAAGNRKVSYSGSVAVLSITSTASVTEGSPVTLTVTRSNSAGAVSVNYATSNGTAIAGPNYIANSGTINFAAGQSSQTIQVSTRDDGTYDGALTFNVKLSSASLNAAIGSGNSVVTINEASAAPNFTVASNGSVGEGNPSVFTITRSGATSLTQAVSYATANGTASAGVDYTNTSYSISFPPSVSTQTVSVPTAKETNYEGTRSFTFGLSNPTNGATASSTAATGVITDTDPAISFAINTPATVTAGTPITFTVSKNGGPAGMTFNVNYATANGSAIAGTDYTASGATLTFPAGTTSQPITINTAYAHQDSTVRNFYITLSNATNAAPIGPHTGTGSIQAVPQPLAPVVSPGYQYTTTGTLSISWPVPGGSPTSYQVYQSSDNSPTPALVSTQTGTSFSKTITGGANNGIQFYYYVQACNANGCSPNSNTATVAICLHGSCSS